MKYLLFVLWQFQWSKLDEHPFIATVLAISVIMGAIVSISTKAREFIRWGWKQLKWFYSPFTVQKRADDLDKKLIGIDEKLDKVLGEVTANGGGSIKDAVNTILLTLHVERESRRAVLGASGLAFWESDRDGMCVYASEKLAELVGSTPEGVQGNGWVSNLDEKDKSRVFGEWQSAVAQRRRFVMTYTFVHADGTRRKVQGMSIPIIRNDSIEGFVGVLTELSE